MLGAADTPIDYLVVGHLTKDLTPEGPRLGGTVAYAALMAHALGLRVGIVTSWAADLPLGRLEGMPIVGPPSEVTTTFENRETPAGRVQVVHAVAEPLALYHVPETWRRAPIVHLAPVAQEVATEMVRGFSAGLVGLTPQGWLREWDAQGRVRPTEWPEYRFVLEHAGATVLSIEDLGGDESMLADWAAAARVLVVTRGQEGADLFWRGEVVRITPPAVEEVDPTGAGDVFAAAFFIRLYQTRDPLEAARFATRLAASSVTRPGLDGVPDTEQVFDLLLS